MKCGLLLADSVRLFVAEMRTLNDIELQKNRENRILVSLRRHESHDIFMMVIKDFKASVNYCALDN